MPIDIDGQTIWVECVESQKGAGDAIMMDLVDTEGENYLNLSRICFFRNRQKEKLFINFLSVSLITIIR